MFKPYTKPQHKSTDPDSMCLVTLNHVNLDGLPVERRFYWRLKARLLFDPEGLEESWTLLLHNLGVNRYSITSFTILPVLHNLPDTVQQVEFGE